MQNSSKRKKLIILGSVAVFLVAVLITLLILRTVSPTLADAVTMNITQWWVYIIGHINSVLPVSVFEGFIILAIISLIIFIILLIIRIVKRNFFTLFKSLLIFAIIALSLGNFYTLTAGFAYYRSAISIPQSTNKYDNPQIIDAATYFIDDYNALATKFKRDENGNVISPYSIKELSNKIAQEFTNFNSDYLFDYTPRAKPIFNSWFMTLTSITGITFVPFGEPNINKDAPSSDIPQVMAHEMSHAKGVMREGDCNFLAYYILLSSSDDYLRYCGYFSCFGSMLSAVDAGEKTIDNYKELSAKINPLIKKELQNSSKFWSSKANRQDLIGFMTRTMNSISKFFNDMYLRLNGLDNGTGSYDDSSTDGDITDTGETDPDTGDIIYEVTRSSIQKMYLYLYENAMTRT